MTTDERLEFLVQSTESLHASLQEMHGMMRVQIEREGRLRKALLRGIAEYLTALDDGENKNGDGKES
jgi:hypothetical protein